MRFGGESDAVRYRSSFYIFLLSLSLENQAVNSGVRGRAPKASGIL